MALEARRGEAVAQLARYLVGVRARVRARAKARDGYRATSRSTGAMTGRYGEI